MKRILSLLTAFCFTFLFAQEYTPLLNDENAWIVSSFAWDFDNGQMHYDDFQIRMTDEIITHNEKSYIGLEQRSRYRIDDIPQTSWGAWETIPVYLSENTADKKVFIYYAEEFLWHEAGEFLLYNFGMEIGDFMTFEGFIEGEIAEPAEVTDITYESVFDRDNVKTFHFANQEDFEFIVYEGICTTHGLFTSSFMWDAGWVLTDFGTDMGLNNFFKTKAKIYPNPFMDQIQIETEKPIQNLKLFESNGRLIYSESSISELNLNLNRLNQGVYILRITHGDHSKESIKLIKK